MAHYLPRHITSISAAENLIRSVIDDITWSPIPIDARYQLLIDAHALTLKALRALGDDKPHPLLAHSPVDQRTNRKPRP